MTPEEILQQILPEYLVKYFDIIQAREENEVLHIEFEEKHAIPEEFLNRPLNSKGFLPSITIEDFPLRGRAVRLHIKRRRWKDTDTGETLQRDWNLVAKGTKMTADFAAFLKEVRGY